MNKHSILLVVSKPDVKDEWNQKLWVSLSTKLVELSNKQTDFELLGENVLLIQPNNNLISLSEILSEMGDLDYKYAIFDEEIQLIVVANKP